MICGLFLLAGTTLAADQSAPRDFKDVVYATVDGKPLALDVHMPVRSCFTPPRGVSRQGNNPKTATLFVVATNTLPSATVGTMNLLPVPK